MADDLLKKYLSLVDSGELDEDQAQENIARHLSDLCSELENAQGNSGFFSRFVGKSPPELKGVYIYGGVGRGKSMLMDLFYDVLKLKQKKRVHFHEFMQDVHSSIHEWRQRHKASQVKGNDPIAPVAENIAAEARVLCFDEFIVNDITDAMILGRLFTALFEKGVVVVATSNRAPETLYEGGLNRALFLPFIAELQQRMNVLHLDHETDYRMMNFEGLTTYYTPLGTVSAGHIQHAWEQLTGHAVGEKNVLRVLGRDLIVPQTAHGVARFDFDDLCVQPRGAADFLKLARTYHTVILENIPELNAAKRNEARRFITLIDTLYDNGVMLVVSAAAKPEGIYVKGDGRFEFDRTVSRLLEMQSQAYLSLGHGGSDAIAPVPSQEIGN